MRLKVFKTTKNESEKVTITTTSHHVQLCGWASGGGGGGELTAV